MLFKRRNRFDDFSAKVGRAFSKVGLSPNQWTIISLAVVLIALYFLMQGNFLAAAVLFITSSFLDLVDGSVARVTGKVSRIGGYLDTIVDRYVEGIIIIGLMFVALPAFALPASVWLIIYLFGSMMTTYSKAAAFEKGVVTKELRGGFLERAERLVVLFIGLLAATWNPIYLTYVIAALAVVTNFSALQRIGIALKA